MLIRRLEPQGEKSRGFSGHAFARVPVLEWLSGGAPEHILWWTRGYRSHRRISSPRLAEHGGEARAVVGEPEVGDVHLTMDALTTAAVMCLPLFA